MAQCSDCKEETERYDGGDVPVCVECSDRRKAGCQSSASEQHAHTSIVLIHDFLVATARYHEAISEFELVMGQVRNASPDARRIKNVSGKLTIARKAMMKAHRRLSEHPAVSVQPVFPDLPNDVGIPMKANAESRMIGDGDDGIPITHEGLASPEMPCTY